MSAKLDLWYLYRQMLRSRRFEELAIECWAQGRISGELHLGIGEEAVAAGVVSHLHDGDAMALDHRGTPPAVIRGIDLVALLREMFGKTDGLCSGMGGHMHIFSPKYLVASSGIVGASGPLAAGFALTAQYLRTANVAVAFFGDGAVNQGMLMESINLASAWHLPVIFVCKNNGWAITTRSESVTGGDITGRAKGFGLPVLEADGADVESVWDIAGNAVDRSRRGEGPSFLLVTCPRPEGHMLSDALVHGSMKESGQMTTQMIESFLARKGGPLLSRVIAFGNIVSLLGRARTDHFWMRHDPIALTHRKLSIDKPRLEEIEKDVDREIQTAADSAISKP